MNSASEKDVTLQGNKAVVLLSGGLDSAVTAFLAREKGYLLYALTFSYGQRHDVELVAAGKIAGLLQVERQVTQTIDLRGIGGSALTSDIPVPKKAENQEIMRDIPVTYVPARNTIFLACALAHAEVFRAQDIFLGVNAIDYSGYPDCRPEFLRAFERVANLATKAGVHGAKFRIHAPLIEMSKADIIKEGARLGVDFSVTHSCYDPIIPGALACGECESCIIRRKGFADAGVPDPTHYASKA